MRLKRARARSGVGSYAEQGAGAGHHVARRWRACGAGPAQVLPGRARAFFIATKLRQWAADEVAAAHLLPWLAVAFGFGVVLYFTAEHEPAWWAGTGLAVASAASAVALRRHLAAFVAALVIFAAAAGFATATIKTALIAHPVLRTPASGVTVAGFVELREESQHTDRFVLRVGRIDRRAHRRAAAARAAFGQARHGAARGLLCRGQGARSIRRCSRSRRDLTILPAIFIFSASALRALSAVR